MLANVPLALFSNAFVQLLLGFVVAVVVFVVVVAAVVVVVLAVRAK